MCELNMDELDNIAGGAVNEFKDSEKPSNKNDKEGWKRWWNSVKDKVWCCVTGYCPRCGHPTGTAGTLCKECRDWVNS